MCDDLFAGWVYKRLPRRQSQMGENLAFELTERPTGPTGKRAAELWMVNGERRTVSLTATGLTKREFWHIVIDLNRHWASKMMSDFLHIKAARLTFTRAKTESYTTATEKKKYCIIFRFLVGFLAHPFFDPSVRKRIIENKRPTHRSSVIQTILY